MSDSVARVSSVVLRPHELKSVLLSALYFFLLFGSYSVVKPMRDAMGTVYGVPQIHELFTATFVVSVVTAPLYSALASRVRLSTFLPWVYAAIALSLFGFYGLFQMHSYARPLTAGFYVWISTVNLLAISIFWTFMADLYTRGQARRVFGLVAAGGTIGGIAGPAIAALAVKGVGNQGLLLIAASGFLATTGVVVLLTREKERLRAAGIEVQPTPLTYPLPGTSFDGFKRLFQSRYLFLLGLFVLSMTWVSTIIYVQLGAYITVAFADPDTRTAAYAVIDALTNALTLLLQLFGTARLIGRFGIDFGLLATPIIMGLGFVVVALAPILVLLASLQVLRPVVEHAIGRPAREMLYTEVDQESRYRAKNVIDTVVYRFGDLTCAWACALILPLGLAALAVFGVVVSLLWIPVARALGRRYEETGTMRVSLETTPHLYS